MEGIVGRKAHRRASRLPVNVSGSEAIAGRWSVTVACGPYRVATGSGTTASGAVRIAADRSRVVLSVSAYADPLGYETTDDVAAIRKMAEDGRRYRIVAGPKAFPPSVMARIRKLEDDDG